MVTLVGKRFPASGKVFLLTLAIVDDLGGILVIAIFYSENLKLGWLILAAAGLIAIVLLSRIDVRSLVPYLTLGALVWFAVFESGVHATIAGVLVGLLVPTRAFYSPRHFADSARPIVDRVEETVAVDGASVEESVANVADMEELIHLTRESLSPMDRIAHALEPWVAFAIIPIFALANAGVRVVGDVGNFDTRVILGVALGLLIGKPIGVFVASWVAVQLRLGKLPTGAVVATHGCPRGGCWHWLHGGPVRDESLVRPPSRADRFGKGRCPLRVDDCGPWGLLRAARGRSSASDAEVARGRRRASPVSGLVTAQLPPSELPAVDLVGPVGEPKGADAWPTCWPVGSRRRRRHRRVPGSLGR